MRGRGSRTSAAGIAAAVVMLGCAACTGAGGGPAPTTGGVPAPTASGSGTFKGGIDSTTKFTQLTATLLTTPGPVEMSDGKVHLAYELVLTNVAAVPFRVDGVEMHDAATQALSRAPRDAWSSPCSAWARRMRERLTRAPGRPP
jgi:hypothetical protein